MKIGLYIVGLCAVTLAVIISGCAKSDTGIQRDVRDKLQSDGISGVTATVDQGVVTLAGEVGSDAIRAKAEDSVRAIDGVKSVVNKITLKSQPLSASDQALKNKIEENWKTAGCDGAAVEVKDGVAMVSGTVPDAKYAQCLMVLSQSGVEQQQQINNLKKGK